MYSIFRAVPAGVRQHVASLTFVLDQGSECPLGAALRFCTEPEGMDIPGAEIIKLRVADLTIRRTEFCGSWRRIISLSKNPTAEFVADVLFDPAIFPDWESTHRLAERFTQDWDSGKISNLRRAMGLDGR